MGLPKMRVLNVARVRKTERQSEVLSALPSDKMLKQGLLPVPHLVQMFIKAKIPRDKRNWNFELFFKADS
jgi:hypothetical protein